MTELTLWRRSGRTGEGWRQVRSRDPETKFAKIARDLRQGAVELRDRYGNTIEKRFAPRLRTRW